MCGSSERRMACLVQGLLSPKLTVLPSSMTLIATALGCACSEHLNAVGVKPKEMQQVLFELRSSFDEAAGLMEQWCQDAVGLVKVRMPGGNVSN